MNKENSQNGINNIDPNYIKKALLCNGIGSIKELCNKQLNEEAFQMKTEAIAKNKAMKKK